MLDIVGGMVGFAVVLGVWRGVAGVSAVSGVVL
jgi:hypothetical protein